MFDVDNPTLKSCLRAREPLGVFWFALGSVALIENAIANGASAVVVDMQHGLFDRSLLEAAVGAVPPGIPCLVRVEDDTPAAIGRALDAGAEGIIVPLVETAAQARAVAAACHYPPKGCRSGGGVRPLRDFATYRAVADKAITVGVMIETDAGLSDAGAIAGAAGVDFVFVGTGDLAISLGPAAGPKDQEKACATILKACTAAGKPCGIFTADAASAAKRIRQGYWMTVVANDITTVNQAFAGAAKSFAAGTGKSTKSR